MKRPPTSLRLALAALPIAVVSAVLLERLLYCQEWVEKTRAEATARTLQAALRIKMSEMSMRGAAHRWGDLAGQNPFVWLEATAGDYCGEAESVQGIEAGCWVYERRSGCVAYRPARRRFFRSPGGEIRYCLSVVEHEMKNNEKKAVSVRLEPVYPFDRF